MAGPPILTLTDAGLGFGGGPLFANVTLAVHPGERIALVGRNGSGKSTLLKLMAGRVEPDAGERFAQPGLGLGLMAQEPDFAGFATLGDFAAHGFEPSETYRIEAAFGGLKLDPGIAAGAASGGERRRAALARILAEAPDLMLLDEPTNHLDIEAIGWLEAHLAAASAAFVLISHDRAFLKALTRRTLWLDRGELRALDRGFAAFEAWRDQTYAEEDAARHKRDRLIAAEGQWAVEGISARRKRNQGRLRRLADLRAARRAEAGRAGTARLDFGDGQASGRLVIDARNLAKAYDGRTLVRDVSLRVARGERVALVGPNGAGKTTLLRLLTGEIAPDAGSVRLGANLLPAVFDQNRAALDPGASLAETLTGAGRLGGASDQVVLRGQPRHIPPPPPNFLFAEAQARGPVSALSGGEKARLLLARLMLRASNLLVLDEPTNDLDVETLDLLEEIVADYDGTVLLVSHDRDFIDRVATTTLAAEGDGRWTVYAGGWSDHLAQRGEREEAGRPARNASGPAASPAPQRPRPARKLGFRQAHRLERLPDEMERLGAEIARLEALLGDPALFERDPGRFARASAAFAARKAELDAAEEEWLRLAAMQEAIDAGSGG